MTASGLMNIPEAAEYIGVSDKTIRRYIAAGLIASINISAGLRQARWVIRKKELDAFLEKRTAKPEYGKLALVPPSPRRPRASALYSHPLPSQGMGPDGLPNYKKAANPKRKAAGRVK